MNEKENIELEIAWLDKAIEDAATNLQVLIYERKEAGKKLRELEKGD